MERRRSHSAGHYVRAVLRQVWAHPANRGSQVKATFRSVGYQLRKRLFHRPVYFVLPGGVKLRCYNDSTVGSQLWYFGPFTEYHELKFMTRFLRSGDAIIDAGANVGIYSFLAAPIVGRTGRVDAFEPSTVAASRFAETKAVNGLSQVHLHNAAVSDRQGTASFSTEWDVSNRLRPDRAANERTEVVQTVALDEFLSDRQYAFAKLDVEGAEHLALSGARQRLALHNPPVWQVELFGGMLEEAGSSRDEVVTLLLDNGYVLASYDADSNALLTLRSPTSQKNLLAIAVDYWEEVESRLK